MYIHAHIDINYITLRDSTLQYITVNCGTSHYITLQYMTLHNTHADLWQAETNGQTNIGLAQDRQRARAWKVMSSPHSCPGLLSFVSRPFLLERTSRYFFCVFHDLSPPVIAPGGDAKQASQTCWVWNWSQFQWIWGAGGTTFWQRSNAQFLLLVDRGSAQKYIKIPQLQWKKAHLINGNQHHYHSNDHQDLVRLANLCAMTIMIIML